MLKSEVINQAYAQLRISGLTVEPQPEEINIALAELDQMMWEWQGLNRHINYFFPPGTDDNTGVISNPDDEVGVYKWALAGTIACLAKRLVPYFGKEVPMQITRKAAAGLMVIKQRCVALNDQPYPARMPIGSGQRPYSQWRKFYPTPNYAGRGPDTPLSPDSIISMQADFTDFFFPEGRTLASYTIVSTPGIDVLSDSQDGFIVNFRVKPKVPSENVSYTNGTVFVNGISSVTGFPPEENELQRSLQFKFNVVNNQLAIVNA